MRRYYTTQNAPAARGSGGALYDVRSSLSPAAVKHIQRAVAVQALLQDESVGPCRVNTRSGERVSSE